MTTTGSSPFDIFSCDAGSLEVMLGDTRLSCPCCNGRLTPEKLARLFGDVQRLAQGRIDAKNTDQAARHSAGAPRYAGMIIDPHAHMISRTTDDYEAMAKAGVVAV